ncbi:MAG TPA: HAMP domain-containing sensor histidine kinase [Anaeromyxobacteraceae bacterium]|nr:HAMP domain-containing sensor histidine kinase [Anaeromyxobacteraceae bacterium]
MTRPRLRLGHLVLALTAFTALAVGATGGVLLVRQRAASIAALAERQQLLVSLQARLVEVEVERLVAELTRLSQLAEVDLADDNLEPEKRVLRIARRDTLVFSVAIVILDDAGRKLWAEPLGATLRGDPARLVAEARSQGRTVVAFAPGEIEIAAPVAGHGAMVARVSGAERDLFGEALLRTVRGGAVELVAEENGAWVRIAAAGGEFPLHGDADGQSWRADARGRRWLVTEVHLRSSPLAMRLAQPAEAIEAEATRPLRGLAGIAGGALLLAALGGALLGTAIHRLEAAEVELGKSRELAAMGRTAAAIAHEVKNSLNGISMSLDLLASRRATPEAAAAVYAQARTEVARLREVADDLTLFAAPPRLDPGVADLGELCRRAAALTSDLAADCGAEVRLELPPDGDAPQVPGDAHKLLGALQNVVRNGIEAMGPGAFGEALGSRPATRERVLVIRLHRRGRQAVLEVADRGPGIPGDVREHLFEPFVTTKRNGTGLGLAICRRVVEAHGGTVEASPREGGGTVFRLHLPMVAPALAPAVSS